MLQLAQITNNKDWQNWIEQHNNNIFFQNAKIITIKCFYMIYLTVLWDKWILKSVWTEETVYAQCAKQIFVIIKLMISILWENMGFHKPVHKSHASMNRILWTDMHIIQFDFTHAEIFQKTSIQIWNKQSFQIKLEVCMKKHWSDAFVFLMFQI